MMKLYYAEVLAPRKACAVAKYLKAPVEFVRLDMVKGEHKSPDYIALNPNGKVPTLVDGDRHLWEADAIACHLSNRMEADLWPRDGRQIEVLRWLSWASQHFNRHGGALYFEYVVRPMFGMGPPDQAAAAQAMEQFLRFAAVLDGHLEGRRWLVGEDVTVADFSVGVTLPYAAETGVPLDDFPAVRRWYDRLCGFEAWREPFPAR